MREQYYLLEVTENSLHTHKEIARLSIVLCYCWSSFLVCQAKIQITWILLVLSSFMYTKSEFEEFMFVKFFLFKILDIFKRKIAFKYF